MTTTYDVATERGAEIMTTTTTYTPYIDRLKRELSAHAHQKALPVSCTDAARTAGYVREAHAQLARVMAGCHAHMTPQERRYLSMSATGLLALAERS